MLALAHHDWPYNVRELESVIKVACTLCGGEELDARHLPEGLRDAMAQLRGGEQAATSKGRAPTLPRQPAVSEPIEAPPQRRLRRGESPSEGELRSLLERHRGNIAAVGRELGKERMQVHRWLKRFDISIDEYRS